LDLFRNGRLIMEDQKFGISGHPGHAYVKGEVHLDFVPVNQDKNKFLTDTEEYEEALKACAESDIFKQTATASNKKRGVKEEKKFIKNADTILDALAQALRKRASDFPMERTGTMVLPGSATPVKMTVEVREQNGEDKNEEQYDPTNTRTRTPRTTHKIVKYTTKEGKTYSIKHETYMAEDAPESKLWRIEKDTIYVSINTGFPAYEATKDRLYYIGDIIIDSLADIHGADSELDYRQRADYKDSLLKETFEIIAKDSD
jgi:hypothetical protein